MAKKINAFADDALGTMDAVALAEAIATKKISTQEATEAAINRAEQVNPALNGIVVKMYNEARQQQNMNTKGIFFGVPTFVKDNDPIKGYPTQRGVDRTVFAPKPAKRNGKYIDQFFSTGVNCLGKTTLPEFGFICSTENERWGITRNPWDTDYTTGGSSSGSAAMVASGVVPIATANDGAGSTRIPASCCGLVGLKPTRARLHFMHGTESLPVNIVYEGVLTRTVRDTAAFYAAAEQFHYNNKLPRIGHVKDPLKRRLRIAIFENQPEGKQGHMDEDTFRVQLETAKLLETLGHQVEMIKIPLDAETMTEHYIQYYGFLSYMTIHLGRLSNGASVNKTNLEPFTLGLANTFANNKLKLFKSLRILTQSAKKAEAELNQKYDLVLTAVTAKRTPEIGYFSPNINYEEVAWRASDFATYLPLFNISGAPAISLPLGIASNNMPVGVQLVAPHGQDKLLLEIALELEAANPWRFMYNS